MKLAREHARTRLDRIRSFAPIVALAFAFGHLANVLHFASVAHEFCREHQLLEHVGQHRSDDRSSDSSGTPCRHDHDRCDQAASTRLFPTVPCLTPEMSPSATISSAVQSSRDQVDVGTFPIYVLAPKTSPPV